MSKKVKKQKLSEEEITLLKFLKAYFSTKFMSGDYDTTSDGCETCGFGGTNAMSLEKIYDVIDDFIKNEVDWKEKK